MNIEKMLDSMLDSIPKEERQYAEERLEKYIDYMKNSNLEIWTDYNRNNWKKNGYESEQDAFNRIVLKHISEFRW